MTMAEAHRIRVPEPAPDLAPMQWSWVRCCICDVDDCDPIAVGEDFEYGTSLETFRAVRCRRCDLIYLNPRPAPSELSRIYPPEYHSFDFSEERFGLVYEVRRRLEARRLLSWCRGLRENARIVDVGCGDGFHLGLLREYGARSWSLEGVDPSEQAVATARRAELTAHQGTVEELGLPRASYDLALLIMTIEHVESPPSVLSAVREILRPGGRVVIVTDNADSPDFSIAGGRHWGGYHFPRHFNLFTAATLRSLARRTGFEVEDLRTAVSPVNWVFSIRNALVDWRAPGWLVEQFALDTPATLALFTALDAVMAASGRGAILNAVLRRPT